MISVPGGAAHLHFANLQTSREGGGGGKVENLAGGARAELEE